MKAALFALTSTSFSVRYMTDGEASPWLLVTAAALLGYALWHAVRE